MRGRVCLELVLATPPPVSNRDPAARTGVNAPQKSTPTFFFFINPPHPSSMGLLTVLRKVRQKERELRVLMV